MRLAIPPHVTPVGQDIIPALPVRTPCAAIILTGVTIRASPVADPHLWVRRGRLASRWARQGKDNERRYQDDPAALELMSNRCIIVQLAKAIDLI